MDKKTKRILKAIGLTVFFFAALGYAGHSDYVDAVITEMKNNGSYRRLSEEHPTMTESELVELYTENK